MNVFDVAGKRITVAGAARSGIAAADLLVRRGVTRVRDVVADVSAFDRVTIPGSWKVGNLGSDYSAPVDAIT